MDKNILNVIKKHKISMKRIDFVRILKDRDGNKMIIVSLKNGVILYEPCLKN